MDKIGALDPQNSTPQVEPNAFLHCWVRPERYYVALQAHTCYMRSFCHQLAIFSIEQHQAALDAPPPRPSQGTWEDIHSVEAGTTKSTKHRFPKPSGSLQDPQRIGPLKKTPFCFPLGKHLSAPAICFAPCSGGDHVTDDQ